LKERKRKGNMRFPIGPLFNSWWGPMGKKKANKEYKVKVEEYIKKRKRLSSF
jgi:hypothetical protein